MAIPEGLDKPIEPERIVSVEMIVEAARIEERKRIWEIIFYHDQLATEAYRPSWWIPVMTALQQGKSPPESIMADGEAQK